MGLWSGVRVDTRHPERAAGTNIYEAVAEHLARLRKAGKKPVLASYSIGSRERLKGLLADHGLPNAVFAESWQEALGVAAGGRDSGNVALIVLPLDHGFTSPEVALLTEQDMLGDRLVRRNKRKKSTDAFLVPKNGSTWFCKLSGDTAAVQAQADAFTKFLAQAKLP